MSKSFKTYLVVWAAGVVLLAAVALLAGGQGASLLDNPHWPLYLLCLACMAVQLAVAWVMLGREADGVAGSKRLFLGMPALVLSGAVCLLSAAVALVFVNVQALPAWAGAIALVCLLVLDAAGCLGALAAGGRAARIDENTAQARALMDGLAARSQALASTAATPEGKAAATRVREALRYADPMANAATAALDAELSAAFDEFERLACDASADAGAVAAAERRALDLVARRAAACKLGKRA